MIDLHVVYYNYGYNYSLVASKTMLFKEINSEMQNANYAND